MDYKIITKPAFEVLGKSIRVSMKDGENFTAIPAFWRQSMTDGTLDSLSALASEESVTGNSNLGICTDFQQDMQAFTYLIGVETAQIDTPDNFIRLTAPASTWAVFECSGALPEALQTVWGGIMSEFLPSSGYSHAAGPDVEVYPPGDPRSDTYQCEIWVPVVKNS